jgi:hypothetical protein
LDALLKLAVTSPSAALGLVAFALAVVGAATLLFLRGLQKDVDGLGGKVGRIDTQQQRDCDRMGRIETDVKELSGDLRAADKALPGILKNERHAIPSSPTGQLAAKLDERVENLREDHGRRLERLEEKAHEHGGGG